MWDMISAYVNCKRRVGMVGGGSEESRGQRGREGMQGPGEVVV